MKSLIAVTALLCLQCSGAYASVFKRYANPTVTIADGVVIGTLTSVVGAPTETSYAYKGIPYAAPPVRFSPPQKAIPWSKPLVAQALGPACIQQFTAPTGSNDAANDLDQLYFNNPTGTYPQESEDCLTINIFAPTGAGPLNQKAVMVWIFGGNFKFGSAGLNYYNGTRLAYENDVVVVSFNYRDNIFGFSNSPEIPFGQQNSGYLDQRLALQWIQNNIAAFGGNPKAVTLFGVSAGAYSIKQLMANPPNPLPFRAAIFESSAATAHNAYQNSQAYQSVVNTFNCQNAPSPLNCLRAVPASALKSYIEVQGLYFTPADGDGTQMNDVRPAIVSGKFARIPLLAGNNANEGRIFANILGLGNSAVSGPNATAALISLVTGQDGTAIATQLFPALQAAYGANLNNSEFLFASQVVTDLAFICPTSVLMGYLTTFGYPIHRYLYSGYFPNVSPFPMAGAYHSSEIPSVFGSYPGHTIYGDVTPTQVALSAFMRKSWTDFAKNPNAGLQWPQQGRNLGFELMNFGANGGAGGSLQSLPVLEVNCPIYDGVFAALNVGY